MKGIEKEGLSVKEALSLLREKNVFISAEGLRYHGLKDDFLFYTGRKGRTPRYERIGLWEWAGKAAELLVSGWLPVKEASTLYNKPIGKIYWAIRFNQLEIRRLGSQQKLCVKESQVKALKV
jgi:hypothetical protein